jgi:hypothetical protein
MKIKISAVGIIRIVFGVLSLYPVYTFITNFSDVYNFYILSTSDTNLFINWLSGYTPYFYMFSFSVYEIVKVVKNVKSN